MQLCEWMAAQLSAYHVLYNGQIAPCDLWRLFWTQGTQPFTPNNDVAEVPRPVTPKRKLQTPNSKPLTPKPEPSVVQEAGPKP